MDINADLTEPALVHADELEWLASPMPGVHRRMLDRSGDEVARATSIVRYAPGSQFSPHTHGGGEELLVLDGVFEDEHGAYPPGSYVRNPPTSRHTPSAPDGCVIFVKLWQFDPSDRTQLAVDAGAAPTEADPARPGCTRTPLFADARETVRLERWAPGATLKLDAPGGAELLVLDGALFADAERLRAQSWVRVPARADFAARVGPDGARLYLKTGHLAPDALATEAWRVR